MLKRLFWIPEERRFGAVWRIVLHAVLLVMLIFLFDTPLILLIQLLGSDPATSWGLWEVLSLGNQLILLIPFVGSVWLAGKLLDGRRFSDFGLRFNRDWWLDFGFGLALGAFLMALIFAVEWAAGWITFTGTFARGNSQLTFGVAIFFALIRFVSVGIREEMLSRGYHLKNLAEGFAHLKGVEPRAAVLLSLIFSSLVFGLLHLGNPNASWVSTFNIAGAGILLSMGYILTGELAIPIALHITWNFFQGNVFGFPVSGLVDGISVVAIEQGGPDLFTGGAFGPEAGLLGLGAIVLGSVLTVLYIRGRYGSAHLHGALSVPDFLPRKQRLLAARLAAVEHALPEDALANPPI